MLRKELKAYSPEMLDKPFIVGLNKIDQEGSLELAKEFRAKYPFDQSTVFEISALEEINIEPLKEAMRKLAQRESIRYI